MERTSTRYLRDIKDYKPLSTEHEAQLASSIREGDREAFDQLVNANLKYVITVARKYQNRGVPLMDLINEGNRGLVEAATRFDGTKGFRFITYANWWIRYYIFQALKQQSRTVQLPAKVGEEIIRIRAMLTRIEQQIGGVPDSDMQLNELGITIKEMREYIRLHLPVVSIERDEGRRDDGHGSLLDKLTDPDRPDVDNGILERDLRETLEGSFSCLKPRDREILKMYFGIDRTESASLSVIGARFGLSRERIRQIKDEALAKIRQGKHTQSLSDLLVD